MPTYEAIATIRMTAWGMTKQVAHDAARLRIESESTRIRSAGAYITEIEIEMSERTDEV